MSKDTVFGFVGIAVILVAIYFGIRFLGTILGFVFDNLWVSIGLAVVASFGAAVYFASKEPPSG